MLHVHETSNGVKNKFKIYYIQITIKSNSLLILCMFLCLSTDDQYYPLT